MTKLFENQRVLLGFFVLFITILLSMQFDDTPSSANNVEQWVNLTNQMFYGSHDFMFSYGPMYWIVGGTSSIYNKFTYIISRLYLTLNYSLFWTILSILLIKNKSYMWLAITYLLCLCTLKVNNTLALFLHTLTLNNALYLLPLVFIYFLEYSQDEPVKLNIICYFLLGLYIGFMFYIRFFFGFIGVVTISTYLFSKTIPHYKNLNLELQLVIFPKNNNFYINFDFSIIQKYKLKLYNINGKLIGYTAISLFDFLVNNNYTVNSKIYNEDNCIGYININLLFNYSNLSKIKVFKFNISLSNFSNIGCFNNKNTTLIKIYNTDKYSKYNNSAIYNCPA